ncbi:EF-hand calcium-binding domain-containing protein 5 [Kappamyces sp. JEL0680]|nr:EF-hand calcium-binding domain-containing protein 5 [Kappamyces sp. JEL0680]
MDEPSRRKILFGRLMICSARSGLAKLDTKAIAELKSYKSPPRSIQLILKGALYLFGHIPKDMKTWIEIQKLVNEDLISAVIAFDPTAAQKPSRIRRAKRIIKALSWRDTNQKSSEPAQLISDWLFVAIILYDIAVSNRKARPDIYAAPNVPVRSSADADAEEVQGEGMDGEIIETDAEILDVDGKAVSGVDLA